jgi:hypothetical protein
MDATDLGCGKHISSNMHETPLSGLARLSCSRVATSEYFPTDKTLLAAIAQFGAVNPSCSRVDVLNFMAAERSWYLSCKSVVVPPSILSTWVIRHLC